MDEFIEIPFGAEDSELKGWEYTIPEDMEAVIKDGKIIVRTKGSKDERIRKELANEVCCLRAAEEKGSDRYESLTAMLAYLEKQKEQKPGEQVDPTDASWDAYYRRSLDKGYGLGLETGRKQNMPTPDWMPKFLDELRSMKHHFDYDEHRHIEGQILAIINWIAPNYFDKKEKEQQPVPALDRGDEIVLKAICEELKDAPGFVERIEGWYSLAKDAQQPAECSDCKEYDLGFERGREEGITAGYNKAMKEMEQKEQKAVKIVRIPKFRVGDIVQHVPLEEWDGTKKITYIDEHGYRFDRSHLGDPVSGGGFGFGFEDEYELAEQKPAEWSEEDEKMIEIICEDGDLNPSEQHWLKALPKRIKSLHPKPHWKPNNEQMRAFEESLMSVAYTENKIILESLYDDLKKL